MLSFTRANGSLMVQVLVRSHNPLTVTHEVINKGPSIARMTSNADISLALARQRVAAIHPGMRTQQTFLDQALQNLGQQLRRNVVGLGDILGAD